MKWKVACITSALALACAGPALALNIQLHPANQGITALAWNLVGTTITIEETWGAPGPGYLEFSGLQGGVSFTVVKIATNNTGTGWNRLANELLDPDDGPGSSDDADPKPYPAHVPAGYTTSHDSDGLHFAQNRGIPRISDVFASVFADELSDARDFLDFFDGFLPNGATGTVQFGLRDNAGNNQPFLLVQRPNEFSRVIPEPATIGLLGLGLVGLAARARRKE